MKHSRTFVRSYLLAKAGLSRPPIYRDRRNGLMAFATTYQSEAISLGALSLSSYTVPETADVGQLVGTILGKRQDSVVQVVDIDPETSDFAIVGNGLAVGMDGVAIGAFDVDLRETNAAAINSPRTTSVVVNVVPVAPVLTAPPTIANGATVGVGQVLDGQNGTYNRAFTAISYRWQRRLPAGEWAVISGALGDDYVAALADVGYQLRRGEIAVRYGVAAAEAFTAATAAVDAPPLPLLQLEEDPELAGDAEVGATLTITPAVWDGTPDDVVYSLRADGVQFDTQDTLTFEVPPEAAGKTITVRELATTAAGTVHADTNGIGPIVDPDGITAANIDLDQTGDEALTIPGLSACPAGNTVSVDITALADVTITYPIAG